MNQMLLYLIQLNRIPILVLQKELDDVGKHREEKNTKSHKLRGYYSSFYVGSCSTCPVHQCVQQRQKIRWTVQIHTKPNL